MEIIISNELAYNVRPKLTIFNKITFGVFEEFFTKQYFMRVRNE